MEELEANINEDGHTDVPSAMRKLKTATEDAMQILHALEGHHDQELPSWWMSKLTLAADYLNKEMLIGLAIVNPVYFFCMMIGAMKNLSISIAVIGGTMLGPFIYLISTEWALLFAGLIAGTIAFLFGGKNGK